MLVCTAIFPAPPQHAHMHVALLMRLKVHALDVKWNLSIKGTMGPAILPFVEVVLFSEVKHKLERCPEEWKVVPFSEGPLSMFH